MGKLILISGGNGSGKSRYAEQLIAGTRGPRYYIATMQPCTEENHRRIRKHVLQRAGLGFQTLELPVRVGDAAVAEDGVVLLEDVANLLSNVLFGSGGDLETVWQDILALQRRCALLVAVSISGLSGEGYAGETAEYIGSLNALNARLLARADAAASMAEGSPVWEKGDTHAVC